MYMCMHMCVCVCKTEPENLRATDGLAWDLELREAHLSPGCIPLPHPPVTQPHNLGFWAYHLSTVGVRKAERRSGGPRSMRKTLEVSGL